jgi:putrescine aminotransferase
MRDTRAAIRYADRILDIVATPTLSPGDRAFLEQEVLLSYASHYNRGLVEYWKDSIPRGSEMPIEWTGSGTSFVDLNGRLFLDCLGGYGSFNLGVNHPRVIAAIQAQLTKLPFGSRRLIDPYRALLAKLLAMVAPNGLTHAFFGNSGAEAVEGAMKLARLYTKRRNFISAMDAFHGKTLGALSLMGKAAYREGLLPLLGGVTFVPFGDATAVEDALCRLQLVGEDVAGVIMEPVQGEAGAVVPPDDFWPKIREACDRYGALLIADEVQTGFGRTGALFAVDHFGVVPDILCLGKSLGGGVMPISAFLANNVLWKALEEPNPFIHTSTFGGNALSCVAAIAAISATLVEDLPRQAAEKGAYLLSNLRTVSERYSGILPIARGKGLLIGLQFANDTLASEFSVGLLERDILVASALTNPHVIRMEPALTISYEDLARLLQAVEDTLQSLVVGAVALSRKS